MFSMKQTFKTHKFSVFPQEIDSAVIAMHDLHKDLSGTGNLDM